MGKPVELNDRRTGGAVTEAEVRLLRALVDEWLEPSALSGEYRLAVILERLLDEREADMKLRIGGGHGR